MIRLHKNEQLSNASKFDKLNSRDKDLKPLRQFKNTEREKTINKMALKIGQRLMN